MKKKLMWYQVIYNCYQCNHKSVALTCKVMSPEKEIPKDGIPDWCPLPDAPLSEQSSRPDSRDDCAWYGGDCGSGEKCSDECYEPSGG